MIPEGTVFPGGWRLERIDTCGSKGYVVFVGRGDEGVTAHGDCVCRAVASALALLDDGDCE